MRSSRNDDLTLNKQWQDEQADRLLGFELLRRAVTGVSGEIPPGVLADKIGVDKGFVNQMTKGIRARLG